MKINETQLVQQIIQYLNYSGHYVWRCNTGMMKSGDRYIHFGKKGMADILGIHKDTGKLIAIEAKVGKNKPTQFQIDFLDDIRSRGGVAILAYDLDTVQREL